MSSLINSAMSGLTAAQAALNTTSNNISNYTVSGYTRQTLALSQAASTQVGGSYYGNGVNVVGVNREYDTFITTQLRGASASSSALSAQYSQISNIDDLFASSTTSLSTSMQSFFTAVQNVVSSADDASARQSMLSQGQGLVSQFKTTDEYLRNLESGVNTTITSSVDQINTYSTQIANLNKQITKLTAAGTGASPNNLLDQRDQLVSELNNIIGVTVSEQDGNYNISIGNGTQLVSGNTSKQLVAMASSSDPSKLTVGYVDSTAGNVEIPEKQLTTGSLAGTLAFRREDLSTARNQLNQLALVFADSFNTQHSAGYDTDGNTGVDFFTVGSPSTVANSKNSGTAGLSATITDSSAVQATDYNVSYDGTSWKVTRSSDNTSVSYTTGTNSTTGDPTLVFDGLEVSISNSTGAAAKDSFVVKPVTDAIVNMAVAITDEGQIAAGSAAGSGVSDNTNAQKLLSLQSSSLVNGKSTYSQAYATMVSVVGNKTSSLETASATQDSVVTQLTTRQQAISGVSLDEEYVNLTQFQQYYLANAQVLQAASTIFDALINIR
ncbi:flagellar hook-associated protein FlgK [Erwiniaceae bacterium BAC15a-03b]|uniref:Flagellar hook-associated protein 1 n=1 Tax=Winslowiella arboricola TaxID=2978220 RepID=A0A9J6PU29_9GAMM|nr:flagellar hook-associated protein FlgK [Winslowiella arboricola]MCU5775413.1 flagellar hook-associated protein FlgK [Winslowiella arboricola]MCU5780190.1 flagellar hook-associated protein FlgK [Winslowiella arboricola]